MNNKNFVGMFLALCLFFAGNVALAQVSDKTLEEKHHYYPGKKRHYDSIPSKDEADTSLISIRFREGTRVRVRDGKLVTLNTQNTAEWEELNRVKSILKQYDVLDKIERYDDRPEEVNDREREESKKRGEPLFWDINLLHRIKVDSIPETERVDLINSLLELDIVEYADFQRKPQIPKMSRPAPKIPKIKTENNK